MRHFLLFTLFLCGVVSCLHTRKTTTQKSANPFSPALYGFEKDSLCLALIEDVKQHWRYDTVKKIYKVEQILINKITNEVYADCFKNMDTAQCKRLLGKDSGESPIELQYFLNTACNDNPFQSCYFVCLRYDRIGKIIRAEYCAVSGHR